MKYRVEITDRAKNDLIEVYRWIAADSPVEAARWVTTLEAAILDLDVSPERCAVAPESDEIGELEVRHLIVGVYRVLFTVPERVVFVLHIRHGNRRAATGGEIETAIREREDLGG